MTTSATTGGHEERAAERFVEAHTTGPAFAVAKEMTLAKTSGAPLPSERSVTPATAGGEALEGGVEGLGRSFADEVEEQHQPEQDRGVPDGRRRGAEAAVEEEAKVVDVPRWRARGVRYDRMYEHLASAPSMLSPSGCGNRAISPTNA